jgi:ketol-acid reductoisomerase
MYNRVSETARFGGLTRGPRIIDESTKSKMKNVLSEIQSGEFAKEWVTRYQDEGKNAFKTYMRNIEDHQIEQIGKMMRKMMWPEESH